MTDEDRTGISDLLSLWTGGDEGALSRLLPRVYPELRRLARLHMARMGEQTLESAALANEVYLKLVRAGGIRCENRVHFLALCAQMMRRILVDHARSRGYAKRGANAPVVELNEAVIGTDGRNIDLMALDEALERLTLLDSRKSRVVELRFFGGLTIDETAQVLNVSTETVSRDWKMAKAWLASELVGERPAPE